MKQTNNAIKFLLAQYRAIFKHAYLKGLASAVVLTAGLAAGASANAADQVLSDLSTVSGEITIVSTGADGETSFDSLELTVDDNSQANKDLQSITISGTSSSSGKAEIVAGGESSEAVLDAANVNLFVTGDSKTLDIKDAATKSLNASFNEVTVKNGTAATLNIESVASGLGNTVTLNALNVGDSSSSGTVSIKGAGDTAVATLNGGIITLGDKGTVTLSGSAAGNAIFAGQLSQDSTGKIKVATGTSGTISTYTSGGESTKVTLDLSGTSVIDLSQTESKTLTLANTGKLNVGTSVTIASGSTLDVSAITSTDNTSGIASNKLTVAEGAELKIGAAILSDILSGSSDTAGTLTVDGKVTLNADSDVKDLANGTITGNGIVYAESLTNTNAAAATFGEKVILTTPKFTLASGSLGTAKPVVTSQLIVGTADAVSGTITLSAEAGSSGSISGTNTLLLSNTSTLAVDGSWSSTTGITVSGDSAKAALTLDDGDSLTFRGANGVLTVTDSGEVTVDSGANLAFSGTGAKLDISGSAETNTAKVSVNQGTLTFGKGTELSVTSGSLTAQGEGTFVDISQANVTGGAAGLIVADDGSTIKIGDVDTALTAGVTFQATTGGTLQADSLTLNITNSSGFNISGILSVGDLTVSDSISSITDGTVLVTKSLTGPTTGAAFSAGTLQLGADENANGSIKSDLTVGNTTNVFGTWKSDSEKNINVAGTLNVGDADTTASLTTNKFTSTSGKTTVAAGSTLTANEIAYTTGEIEVNGNMTVNGTKPNEIPETVTDGYAGFGLTQATGDNAIKVNANGTFTIGSGAADSMITSMEWTKPETTPEGDQGFVYNNFGQYDLTNGGTLSLQFSSSNTKFTAEQLKELKLELIKNTNSETGVLTNGKLDLGAAKLESLEGILVESADGKSYTVSWDDYQSAIQDGGMADTMNDDLAATKVTGVNSAFYGNAGSVQLKSGTSALEVEGTTALAGADTNNGYFVSTSDGKKAAGLDVITSAVKVSLQGSGQIGQVTLVAGDTDTNTTLSLEAGRNAAEDEEFEITVAGVQAVDDDNGEILSNTAVNVAQNVTANFTDDVKVDVLTFNGNANFASGSKSTKAESNELSTATGTTVTAGTLQVNKLVNVQGNLRADTLSLTDTLSEDEEGNSVKGVVAGTVEAKKFDANNISLRNTTKVTEFTATDVAIEETSVVSAGSASLNGTTDIDGKLLAEKGTVALNADSTTNVNNILQAKEITLAAKGPDAGSTSAASLNVNDGFVSATNITGASGALIAVGADATEENTSGYTGSLAVTGVLDLSGATLKVDPEYGQKTALVAVNALQGQTVINKETQDVGILNGNVFVGQNSALGVGVDLTGLQSVIAQYQDANGSLLDPNDATNPGKYGAIAYFDKPVSIDSKYGLVLTDGTVDELRTYVSGSTGAMQNYAISSAYAPAGVIYFGNNTALAVNTDNAKSGSYITFVDSSKDNAATNGTLVADGGDIVLYGNTFKKSYQLFNKEVVIQDLAGNDDSADAVIDVVTANGFLTGTLDKNSSGSVSLSIDEDNIGVMMAGTSTPVQQTIVAYINGYNGDAKSFEESDVADRLFGYNENDEKDYDAYNNYFLSQVVIGGHASDVEKVARLGVYGGVAQAALTAGASTYEAVNGRMGIGAQTGSITFADNGQGAGLWVTPVYKNHDSDGFDAQGVSYGADLDLYGVALGGDYTLANGLRVGAAFNVGSGDADGQGAGAGVSNDFDYYGFTVYGGYTLDKLSVVADISYTAIDNDVEANTGVEKVTASMDSSNLSVGVTGQYAFDMNGVSVTPHAGLRYTYIDMDDYTVKGSEDIAKYSADSASVFSIPVGVTFAKDIVSGDWTIKPALDLTLTANMGDDSVDGSVTWAGVENLKTNLESEVIDNFTYGATLGVSAKSGNMSFGFGVNYTGASSADEYGVSANARFVF